MLIRYKLIRHILHPAPDQKAFLESSHAVAYALKMSYKSDYKIKGFFEYVVPPLEVFWWQGERHPVDAVVRTDRAGRRDDVQGVDYGNKDTFNWISVIRLPDFVTRKDFEWAVDTATKKKKLDCSKAEFLTIDEGLCVQMMHIGPFDNEPESVTIMDEFLGENGYTIHLLPVGTRHPEYLDYLYL